MTKKREHQKFCKYIGISLRKLCLKAINNLILNYGFEKKRS